MKVTQVKIRKLFEGSKALALVSIVMDDQLAIHDIKVIAGQERVFVAMPSRRGDDKYRDIVHPIDIKTRQNIEDAIIAEYCRSIAIQKESDI